MSNPTVSGCTRQPSPSARRCFIARARRAVIASALLLNGACDHRSEEPQALKPTASAQVRVLPFNADAAGILAADFDRDGRLDFSLISHAANRQQFFYQTSARTFTPGPESTLVGFHPGDLIPLAPERALYLQFAEGANELITFEITPKGQLLPRSRRHEELPRHGAVFHWPGWGLGLAVVPFSKDYLVLYKNVDPLQLDQAERFVVPLAAERPSLRNAERLTVADVDGDGIDEILLATVYSSEIGMIRRPKPGHPPSAEGVAMFESGFASHLAAADLNDDGAVDLVVPDSMPPARLHLLINDGKGQFDASYAQDLPGEQGNIRMAAGRDQDGSLYLVGCGFDTLTLFQVPRRWDGRSPLPSRTIPLSRQPGHAIQALMNDHDGDGALDIIIGDGAGAWIFYGPLWKHFEEMRHKPLVIH